MANLFIYIEVEDLALALMPGDNLRFDAASGKRSQAKNGPTITDSNRERYLFYLFRFKNIFVRSGNGWQNDSNVISFQLYFY